MNQILHDIDMNTMRKRIEIIKKNMNIMDNTLHENEKTIGVVESIYNKVLLKDQPVGSALNVIKHSKTK